MKITDKTGSKLTSLQLNLKTARECLEGAKALNDRFEALAREQLEDAQRNRSGAVLIGSAGIIKSDAARETDKEALIQGRQGAYRRIGEQLAGGIRTLGRIEEDCAAEEICIHGVEAAAACGSVQADTEGAYNALGHLLSGAQISGSADDSQAALKLLVNCLKAVKECRKVLAAMRVTGSELAPAVQRCREMSVKRSEYLAMSEELKTRLETTKQSIDLRDPTALAQAASLIAAISIFPDRLRALNAEIDESERHCLAGCEGYFKSSLWVHVLELEARIIAKLETQLRGAFSDATALREAALGADTYREIHRIKGIASELMFNDPKSALKLADQLMELTSDLNEFEKKSLS